jgi:transposase InsO family protein/transposase-like protein
MTPEERMDLVKKVELQEGKRNEVLESLGIPRSTYYHWRRAYDRHGLEGFRKMKAGAKKIWNRLNGLEEAKVLEIAKLHPELSPRLLAVWITDHEVFTVSESTVYRILKQRGLVAPRPLPEMPAAKEWRHKTRHPDELWQCDATNLFIVGWGYYKLIIVEDDYSRLILAWDLRPDESAFSVSDVVEMAIEKAKREGRLKDSRRPKLYTDNGPGFTSDLMAGYLATHGIKHIFGTPYRPQGRGKIERLNRRLKEKLCLVVYCSPEELIRAIAEAVAVYNQTPHESLANVSPNDVYAGRKEEILKRRAEKKRLTLERRKQYNLNRDPNPAQNANSNPDSVSKNS